MEYAVEAVHQEGLRFVVTSGPYSLTTDYPLQDETGAGPRPLEMLLASLASCAGGALVVLLRKAGRQDRGLKVSARGQRRAEHPTVFTEIALEFVVCGPVDPAAVAKAIEDSEERVCPVWAMLRPATPISPSFIPNREVIVDAVYLGRIESGDVPEKEAPPAKARTRATNSRPAAACAPQRSRQG